MSESRWHDCALLPPSADAPSAQKVPKDKKVCHVSIIVKVNITFGVVVISCTEWQGEIVNVVNCLIGIREFFEDILEVVPIKYGRATKGSCVWRAIW